MKLAISGKGGVGKSTVAATLALLIAGQGKKVLAVDADPDANLASALGISAEGQQGIIPISKQVALIEERTGAAVNQYGQMFKINPEVSDIAGKYAYAHHGVDLLVLGAATQGGGGCACPENVLLGALVTDLVLYKDETLIMDMEAGVEHLGRATARGVDTMLVVVEPGQRSVDCARRIIRMAGEIGIGNVQLVANKIARPEDERFIREAFPAHGLLAVIPYTEELKQVDRDGKSVMDEMGSELRSRFHGLLTALEAFSA